ncbi:MAG: trypsin-like peptidase domain-containing protein [Clostridiales bacterium]|nr:trypsin-like peptidase domain-containing protein [Clostridiales bacterium]
MKRTWSAVVSTLVAVVLIAMGINYFGPRLFSSLRTYSQTNCLTDQVTSDMDIYDIAKLYRDGDATVAVKVYGQESASGTIYSSLGSGVCVASKGYATNIKMGSSSLVANKGSYIVTNHHVVDMADSNDYTNTSIEIITEAENSYPCTLLWANENLDVAVLYCDAYNLNYISMKDIIIDCEEKDRFDYQPVFAIGCPLDEKDYLNRLTLGNIATNDVLTMYTAEVVGNSMVMSNMYEDVVDIAVGITSGNSGGGCFDENGYLIGLTTLGTSESVTAGNQMNGMVAIYPVMKILDRLIENNEVGETNTIYTLANCGVYGIDAYEASVSSTVTTLKNGVVSYYLNGEFYSASSYSNQFKHSEEGYLILKTSTSSPFKSILGTITSCKDAYGNVWKIKDRNDFIYFLLSVNNGETITVYYTGSFGMSKTAQILL